ncbi:MAG: Fe-S protein assembly co-chaperone HscB [Gammaproteobacteria bacterium]|nr:Fe-S protein assembly co-chaperone HscB [Gammaproteobacteria bacterium]
MTNLVNNYFELFGLKPLFSVNKQELDTAYRQLQQVNHPDRFVNESSDVQRRAVQQTAQNTEAYQSLKSPVLRACHLLALAGSDFSLGSYTVSDINLLMQQMEYREQLADIKEHGDFENLTQFADKVDSLIVDTVGKISCLFGQGVENNTDNDFTELKNNICELQFLNKLIVDLNEVEEYLLLEQ